MSNNRTYTEAEVTRLVVPGASRESVEKAFGQPSLTMRLESGRTMAIYRMENVGPAVAFQDRFTGFQVRYHGDTVEKWFPVYSDQSVSRTTERGDGPEAQTNRFEKVKSRGILIFSVSESQVANGIYVSTPALQNLGFIASEPDLAFQRVESLNKAEEAVSSRDGKRRASILIGLATSEATRLGNFTRDRVGKRILITVDRRPVAAPYILAPIDTGRFSISFDSEGDRDDVFRRVEELMKSP